MEEKIVDERLESFIQKIQDWIGNNAIDYGTDLTESESEEIEKALSMSGSDFNNLSASECNELSFLLLKYLRHLSLVIGHEKAIQSWVDQFFNYMVNRESYDKYTTREQKICISVKNNPLCNHLFQLLNLTTGKILASQGQIQYVENMVKCLERKIYERKQS